MFFKISQKVKKNWDTFVKNYKNYKKSPNLVTLDRRVLIVQLVQVMLYSRMAHK